MFESEIKMDIYTLRGFLKEFNYRNSSLELEGTFFPLFSI